MQRKRYSKTFKLKVLNDIKAGRKSENQILKELGITKYQLIDWQGSLSEQSEANKVVNFQSHHETPAELTNLSKSSDPKDKEIFRLKIKIVDLIMEIDKLKADLNGNKRNLDKELYIEKRAGY